MLNNTETKTYQQQGFQPFMQPQPFQTQPPPTPKLDFPISSQPQLIQNNNNNNILDIFNTQSQQQTIQFQPLQNNNILDIFQQQNNPIPPQTNVFQPLPSQINPSQSNIFQPLPPQINPSQSNIFQQQTNPIPPQSNVFQQQTNPIPPQSNIFQQQTNPIPLQSNVFQPLPPQTNVFQPLPPQTNVFQPQTNTFQPLPPQTNVFQPQTNTFQPQTNTFQPQTNTFQPQTNTFQPSQIQQLKKPIPVTLLPTQHKCVEEMIHILSISAWCMNTSKMGAGKTDMTAYLEQYYRFPYMICLSPAGIDDNWKSCAEKYGLPLILSISYESLAGRKEGFLDHGLLFKSISPPDPKSKSKKPKEGKKIYTVTDYFKKLCAAGLFLVLDESSKIKNDDSDNHHACAALINYMTSITCPSRVMYLSGSPFDDSPQIVSFLRMNNIIHHRQMYITTNGGNFELVGGKELINYCNKLDVEETQKVLLEHPFTKNTINSTTEQLYSKVIQKHITAAAPTPESKFKLDVCNYYYNLSDDGQKNLERHIKALHGAANYDDKTEQHDEKNTNWGGVTKALVNIELTMVEAFYRDTINILKTVPNSKVCIMVNFTGPANILAELLKDYNPLIYTGVVNKKLRKGIREKFQEANLNHRVIICNIVVAAYGYDMDDTNGNFPHYFLISPNYRPMLLHQAAYRGLRPFTNSQPVVRFVYGKCGKVLTSIINSLARKKITMKNSVIKQLEHDDSIKFPGEYNKVEEPDFIVPKLQYTITENDLDTTEEKIPDEEQKLFEMPMPGKLKQQPKEQRSPDIINLVLRPSQPTTLTLPFSDFIL